MLARMRLRQAAIRRIHACVGISALVLVVATTGCSSVAYLAGQAGGQLSLLQGRRRIVEVLADPRTPPVVRARLALAFEARRFGIEYLGLRGGDAFTRYLDTGNRPVAWNLTAAAKDRLRLHMHRFPIVGRVPYLGFFAEADARRAEEALRALDLDTHLRPVSGYSTLGITADPIYSSMLDGDDARIVEVVLHEMTHTTFYLSGQSAWNESVATFVGINGAALFFAERRGADAGVKILEEARRRRDNEARFGVFLNGVLAELEALYASQRSRQDKLVAREEIYGRAQARFLELFPPPPGARPGAFATRKLNNAVLLAHGVYHSTGDEHQRLFDRLGRDLGDFVSIIKEAVETRADPLAYLRRIARAEDSAQRRASTK
jgi:predicted aminopeptidase